MDTCHHKSHDYGRIKKSDVAELVPPRERERREKVRSEPARNNVRGHREVWGPARERPTELTRVSGGDSETD